MTTTEPTPARGRREPPRFRLLTVRRAQQVTPHLVRVTLGGPDLRGLVVDEPAASVRLLLPSPGPDGLVIPTWNGNEFLLPDGRRPVIRTFTPRRFNPETLDLELEVVLHPQGAASRWAEAAEPGMSAALSGPGRGYAVDGDAPAFVLCGDESALPAISQLLEVLPPDRPVHVLVEVSHPDARLELPDHPSAVVEWTDLAPGSAPGDTLLPHLRTVELFADARLWVAGEAASVQRIRRYLFEERGLPRDRATVRGYWKHGRSGDA